MFTLKFRKSHSKNYHEVLKLASVFDNYVVEGDEHHVDFDIKEIFEKWDFFNLLFWRTVDWKGATFGYDGYHLYSHCDKTRIFYAVQAARVNWLCLSEGFIKQLYRVRLGQASYEEIKKETFTDEERINFFLDLCLEAKCRFDYEKEYGHLNFKTPRRNSDFSKDGELNFKL